MKRLGDRREWQPIPTLLLALIVVFGAAIAGLWWWAGTPSSLEWTLRRIARSQPFTAEGVSGTLRSGLAIGHLHWEREGLLVEADDVELAWQPLMLLAGTVKLDRLHAAALRITDRRPPTGEPFKLPDALTLRPEIEVDDLAIGQLLWTAAREVRVEGIAGRYWYDGTQHAVRLDTLRWAGGNYRANASLGAVAPFTVSAKIAANVDAPPVPGTTNPLPVAVTAWLDGPLADMRASAQVRSSAAGLEATHATAKARITPWAAQPVPEAQADMSGLDIAAIWPQAPQTQLTGHVRVTPSGTATWQVDADVRNDLPGPWDEHRLPVAQLKTSGEWRAGMALVRELDAQLGGGRMQASGQWQPGAAGWTLHGKVTQVDPAALHTQLAAAPVSGRLDLRQDGAAIAFDVALQGSGHARQPARASARAHKAAPIELRELLARGRWSDGHLSLPSLTARTADASLRGALEVTVATRAGSGRLDLQAPGLKGSAQGQLSEKQGRGTLRVEGSDLALAERWLRRLPGLGVVVKAPDIGGRATASLAWQGGWRDPEIQARVTSSALELRSGNDPRAAPTWAVTDLIALIDGRLSDASLVLQAHAKQGQRQVGLQLAGRGGSTPLRAGAAARWRGHVTKLALDVQDPGVSPGAWMLVAQRPIDVQWSSGERALDITAGQAKLSAPAIRGTASASQATLSWDPVRWRAGELRTAGRISGLPLAWLELVGGPQLAGAALSGNMVFDGQWDASLGRTVRLNASLARTAGDVTVLAETGEGVSSRVAAGVHEARLTLTSEGNDVVLALRWNSERAGVADGRIVTRLSSGDGGWQWPESAPLSGTLRAQLPRIGVWSLLAPPGWRLRGSLSADVKVGGTRANPQLAGTIAADDLALRSVVDGVELRNGRMRARLEGQRVVLTEFTLHGAGERDGGGTLSATGEAAWVDGAARVQASAQLARLRASIRSDRQLTLSGKLEARLEPAGAEIRGNLKVDQARIELPDESEPRLGDDVVVRNTALIGATAAQRKAAGTPQEAAAAASKRPVTVAVDIDLGNDFQVRGRGLDTRLRGTLALSGRSLTSPQLVGTITTAGGEYRAYGQRLDVERGILRFTGRLENPALDILAVRPNITQRVGVLITGTAQAPFVRLYAVPDLPDAEKLAWLVTGRPAPATGAEAALVQQAALALLSSRRPGAAGLASRVGLDELSVRRDSSEGAVVTLGKRFARNFYASYERSLSGALGTLYIFYDVSRRLTVRAQAGERTGVDLIFTFLYD